MSLYSVQLESKAERQLERLSDDVLVRVDTALADLAENPRPLGCLKLKGKQGPGWRIRVGQYRIVYLVDDTARLVQVLAIGKRESVYKDH